MFIRRIISAVQWRKEVLQRGLVQDRQAAVAALVEQSVGQGLLSRLKLQDIFLDRPGESARHDFLTV
jgi:hypothetical protein